jgi:hypothetical protein
MSSVGFREALLEFRHPCGFIAYNNHRFMGTGGDGKDTSTFQHWLHLWLGAGIKVRNTEITEFLLSLVRVT